MENLITLEDEDRGHGAGPGQLPNQHHHQAQSQSHPQGQGQGQQYMSGPGAPGGPGPGGILGEMGPGMGMGMGGPPHPPQQQQLPPQMFTTAAQLLDLTDKKLMVALRDGRKFIGVLRSWDQFANLVLQSTIERIYIPPSPTTTPPTTGLFADIPRGVFLVRGENVLLLGEIDLDKDDDPPPGYEKVEPAVVYGLDKERRAKMGEKEKVRLGLLRGLGFEGEGGGDVVL